MIKDYSLPIELYVIIGEVVDAMRETNTITSIESEGNYYRYTSTNTLSKNDYISLISDTETKTDLKVISADSTGFVLDAEYSATSYKANAPYYIHEKEVKLANVLTEKTKQETYRWQKYPLITLIHPYTDKRDSNLYGYITSPLVHIITNTNSNDWSDDRYNTNFEPVLFPLYKSFIEQLAAHNKISGNRPQHIEHEKTDLLYIDGNPFPDKMDGITIKLNDLKILTNNKCNY